MSISYASKNKPWDLVIIGGGPIGLSAAKTASEYDLNIIVLEKGDKCGFEVRAETVFPDPVITQIWGSDFLDNSLVISSQSKIIMHSPGDIQKEESIMIETPHSYHWDKFISKMTDRLKEKPNVKISLNTAVVKAVIPEKDGCPVEAVETSQGIVYGKTILDCSGYKTPIGRQKEIDINYDLIVDPIVKARYSNYPYKDDNKFHFYFITAGTIRPQSPPCAFVMFPNAADEVEVGCQFFTDFGPSGRRLPNSPGYTNDFLLSYFNDIKTKAPGIAEKMKGLKIELEYLTGMPAKRIVHRSMYYPGLAFCGDAGGFMDPNTNSGLVTGMKSAKYWAEAAKNAVVDRFKWNDTIADQYNNRLRTMDFYKNLRADHLRIHNAKSIVYGMWRTPQALNNGFKFVMSLYNMNNKIDAMKVTSDQYKKMGWHEQLAVVNAILSGNVIWQTAERKILDFLELSKKILNPAEWEMYCSELLYDKLFNKFQGDKDLEKLFKLLGHSSKVEFALERNSKFMIVKYVDLPAIKSVSLSQCADLVSVILNQRPLLLPAQQKILEICAAAKSKFELSEFKQMINEIGGKKILLKYIINSKVKSELEKILK